MPLILCSCGCKKYFERTHPREKVMPEHRYKHRLQQVTVAAKKLYELRKKQGLRQKHQVKQDLLSCDAKCPTCGVVHRVRGEAGLVVPRIYCHQHECNRMADEDNIYIV